MITFNKRRDQKVSLHRTRDAVVYRAVSYPVNFPRYLIYHPPISWSYIYLCYPVAEYSCALGASSLSPFS